MKLLGSLLISLSVLLMMLACLASTLAPIVFVVFLVLKLCAVIAFSWFWVCFPLIALAGIWTLAIASALYLED